MPKDKAAEAILRLKRDNLTGYQANRDIQNKKQKAERSESARIEIPPCRNPPRREACLADPERFLRTYFADKYRLGFGRDHRYIIQNVIDIATNGGRQAIAAPRGRGKSETVKGATVYAVLRGLCRFPLPVAATTALAKLLFDDFKRKIAYNELLLEDFPEVCWPVRCLEGAPQRAAKQHVDGRLTRIAWSGDYCRLPDVPDSPYGGVKITYFGLDAAFRGVNIDGDRPDFIIIDDPETAESARSLPQIETRESTLDKDVAGLASQDGRMAIIALTTVQKCYSLSAKITDPKIKPAWNGKRFGLIERWPENLGLWDEYISIRRANQEAGDRFGMGATEFYIANREAMDAGVVMLSDHFNETETEDGRQAVLSAIQQAYNKICDTSLSAFKSEYQNDPDPEEQPETVGLTAGKVASRISGLEQGMYHSDTEHVTVGLDIGKYFSHWVKVAWRGNAIGDIVDYGIMETPGMSVANDPKAVAAALLPALHGWRADIKADGKLDFCLIDSGDYSEAIYEFVRQVGGTPFAASKGWDAKRFHMPKESPERRPFSECYASRLPAERIWLYNVNTEHWKQWLQERFAVATFDDQQQRNDGTLALFATPNDRKKHLSISHHIVAEERRDQFVAGKGIIRKWTVVNKNNHFLDALALACAAAGCLGVRIIPKHESTPVSKQLQAPRQRQMLTPRGNPFLATQRRR